jgi:hypothetical protein
MHPSTTSTKGVSRRQLRCLQTSASSKDRLLQDSPARAPVHTLPA